MHMTERLTFALELAYRAGRSTLPFFHSKTAVEFKDDRSPVTEADKTAERIIREAIEKKYPKEALLGEEEGAKGAGPFRWVIDPIDGTKSFICGVPLYGTLLSYEEEGKPVLGVCYFPALDEMLYAEKGRGTYLNGRLCRVSARSDISRCTLSCGSHASMDRKGYSEFFLSLAKEAMTTRTWSDAYGHALVATGRIEAMIDPTVALWDVSAMAIIVEEAGGQMTDFKGNPYPHSEAISSNGLLHNMLLRSFAR